jgi:gliding motility-associated-like protein
VSGTLTVTPNFAPTITNFQIETNEGSNFVFSYEIFKQHFFGYPGDLIVSIKIVHPPVNGDLFWSGKKIVSGDQIGIVNGNLNEFSYSPSANFNGTDAVTWNVFDGMFAATTDAVISIKVRPVNDPPVLTNIESEPILYALGDQPISISNKLILNDIDNVSMFGARIALTEDYKNGDLLSLDATSNPRILSTFDPAKGELVLSGKDSKSNYESALHNVKFSSPISGDTALLNKKVTIVVNDSIDDSNVVSRMIKITKVFPELSLVNAFTPNSDGVDDFWDFVNLEFYTEIRIAVFDQNGMQVFDCDDKDCKWDGKIKGKELPAGPYFYSIDLDSGKRTYRGIVTILK